MESLVTFCSFTLQTFHNILVSICDHKQISLTSVWPDRLEAWLVTLGIRCGWHHREDRWTTRRTGGPQISWCTGRASSMISDVLVMGDATRIGGLERRKTCRGIRSWCRSWCYFWSAPSFRQVALKCGEERQEDHGTEELHRS